MPRPRLALAAALAVLGSTSCLGGDEFTDTGAPVIVITSPAGDRVTGQVTIKATVVDDIGVDVVAFFVDETKLTEVRIEPYQYTWPSSSVPDGQHVIRVTAKDAAGNSAVATKVVQVDNSPN